MPTSHNDQLASAVETGHRPLQRTERIAIKALMTEPSSTARQPFPIKVAVATADDSACSGAESFALMVLGDSMTPEFDEGDIVIIEPDGLATDGSFVLAFYCDEWIFRRLRKNGESWRLLALNPSYAEIQLSDLAAVRGVIIQKSRPGRRRASKRYVE